MAKAWTREEEAILRDVCSAGVPLVGEMDRLPGRTWDAAKTHASRLGIVLSSSKPWSPEEIAILKRVWRSKSPIKVGLKGLPGRSYAASKSEATRLGFTGSRKRGRVGYGWLKTAIKNVLAEDSPLSIPVIAERTGASINGIENILRECHGTEFRIGGWNRRSNVGDYSREWALGTRADEPKPVRKDPRVAVREYQQRQKIKKGGFNPFASLAMQVAA